MSIEQFGPGQLRYWLRCDSCPNISQLDLQESRQHDLGVYLVNGLASHCFVTRLYAMLMLLGLVRQCGWGTRILDNLEHRLACRDCVAAKNTIASGVKKDSETRDVVCDEPLNGLPKGASTRRARLWARLRKKEESG